MYSQWFMMLYDIRIVLLFLLVFLLTTYLMRKSRRDPRWVDLAKKLPGPYDLPLVGTNFSLMLGAKDGAEPYFTRCASKYGPTFRMWMGNHLMVALSDVEDIEAVLLSSSCLRKSDLVLFYARPLIGNGLPAADPVSNWKHKRRAFQPFFTKNNSNSQIPIMNKLIYECVDKMKTFVDGPESNWQHVTDNLALKIFSKMYISLNESLESEELNKIIHALTMALEMTSASALFNCPAITNIWNLFLPMSLSNLKNSIKHYVDEVLDFNKKLDKNFADKDDIDKINAASVLSFMNTLERLQEELSEDDLLCSEITTLLIAGSDTTGTTVSGCLLVLAAHPEIQHKVYEEIYQIFGEDDRLADKSDVEKLQYLDQVIKETQRLYTLVPVLMRQPQSDIKIGPHIYPAGTTIMLNVGGVHHDPKLYPDPYRFNPDNFSPEAIDNRHRCSFVPFSGGARNCLGKTLAEISMKLILVAFLRTFTFHTTKKMKNVKLKPGAVETIASGYPMSITLRKKHS